MLRSLDDDVLLFTHLSIKGLWWAIVTGLYPLSSIARCASSTFLLNIFNINWTDVHRKNVINNVDMSGLRAPWQNGRYKNHWLDFNQTSQEWSMGSPWSRLFKFDAYEHVCHKVGFSLKPQRPSSIGPKWWPRVPHWPRPRAHTQVDLKIIWKNPQEV